MSSEDFYRDLETATKIVCVSRKYDLTLNQMFTLASLYRGCSDYGELQQKSGLALPQFSRDVIGPLRGRKCVTPRRSGKPLSMTKKGRNLFEKVMREEGY